jgi:ATP-binding cassette, subfamily C (CFTR/MRP), member 10
LSPVYAHFGETIAGLTTIRAFRHVTRFIEQNFVLVSNSVRAQFASLVASAWLNFRLQLIGIVMVAGISLISVFEHVYTVQGSNPSLVGLSLSYILSVTGLLNGLISSFTETEKEMVGVERVTAYIDDLPREDDNEPTLIVDHPQRERQGASIAYQHVTMKYNVEQKPALDAVTFDIKSNEKIGIVGRTGKIEQCLVNMSNKCTCIVVRVQARVKVACWPLYFAWSNLPMDRFYSIMLIRQRSTDKR